MTTSDVVETPDEPDDLPESGPIQGMREVLGRRDAKIERLELELKLREVRKLGLDPTNQLGKAALQTFDGDIIEPGSMQQHLTDMYEYEAPTVEDSRAVAMYDLQGRSDEWGATAAAIEPTSSEDLLVAHDQRLASGGATRADAQAAILAKVEHYNIGGK